ncbi:MAG: hypothetical protein ACP5IE_06300 [Infirmifilum sp.]
MRLGSLGRWLKSLGWYLSFSEAYLSSILMLLVYLYVIDRFKLAWEVALSYSVADAMLLVFKSSASRVEPVLVSLHAVTLVSILFCYAREEGYDYAGFLIGLTTSRIYSLKLASYLVLASGPVVLAKTIYALSRDAGLVLGNLGLFLLVLGKIWVNLLIFQLYLFLFYSALAYAVPRSVYYLLLASVELYALETPMGGPLQVYPLYHKLVVSAGDALTVALGYPSIFITAVAAGVLAGYAYVVRGEVKWR